MHIHPVLAAVFAAVILIPQNGSSAVSAPVVPSRTAASATAAVLPDREQTADQQVRHVLNRLAFGARPGDYERVREMGVDAWIAAQLQPSRIADPGATQFLSLLPTLSAAPAALAQEYPPAGQIQQQMARATTAADSARLRAEGAGGRRILDEVQAARVGRAVASERQLEEVLVDFWLNHFSVFAQKNPQMRYHLAAYERDAIRPHVLGKFRDMLHAVATNPAMLLYLDNAQSQADTGRVTLATFGLQGRAGRGRGGRGGMVGRGGVIGGQQLPAAQRRATGLNENYARELLELHTLGVDGGYTQHDVVEVARALTGWSVVPLQAEQLARAAQAAPGTIVRGNFMFRGAVHDAEEKRVLGVTLKAGRGIEDGEQVLMIVSRHPSTANHIARKLATRLVSDSPPPALVARAADAFRRTDGDLREVVRVIVTSDEFFSTAAYRAKVKSPFEVVVSALRAVGAQPDPTPRTAQVVALLGQPVLQRQTPDGWPETGDEWINTGSILNRINFGLALAAGRVPGTGPATWPLPIGIRRESRDVQVDAVVAAFLGGEVSPETRTVLMEGSNPLAGGSGGDTGEMRGGGPPGGMGGMGAGPPGAGARLFQQLPPLEGIPLLVGLALGSPEFQRR